jgi:hypothetical protein
MNIIDQHYLSLQFQKRIFSISGTEFQSFFEDIMEKAHADFKKVPSGGGDGGNDGWIKESGSYYQVYAPDYPHTKDSDAAKKLEKDFEALKINWGDKIKEIKEYYFVFNDKYSGSKKPHVIIAKLEETNPKVNFKLMLAKDLEKVFFGLDEKDILSLGFNIDQRQAISNAFDYLESINIALDREEVIYAQKILKNVINIISTLNDEKLSLEYELLECRCMQKLEKIDEVKEKYESHIVRFPKDSRAVLYLAEIYLNDKDFDKNLELLQKAESLDKDFWLLKLEQLVRKNHLGEKINLSNVDQNTFPDDPKIKSNFYRLYALFFEDDNNQEAADGFIERAIHANPDRFSNYLAKISILEKRLSPVQTSEKLKQAKVMLDEINKIEEMFINNSEIGVRSKATLNIKKLSALHVLENIPEFEKISKETFELLMSCYFDKQIEQMMMIILHYVSLPDDDLNKLLIYIKDSKVNISDNLSNEIIFQFLIRDSLLTEGKKFFVEINNQKYLDFLKNLEESNYEEVLTFLENDTSFAIMIASTLKNYSELRKQIIERLPDDESIQKQKLILLLNYDEKDYDEAFSILKTLDFSELNYYECKPILQIIQQKNAWDFEVIILQKLIAKETVEKQAFNLKLQLFNAHYNLKQYREVIEIGKELLEFDSKKNFLDTKNKEALLINTLLACFERGKIKDSSYTEAENILKKYPLSEPSFEFKVGIEAEVYLYNKKPEQALNALIEGVKIKKIFSSQEYSKLFFLLSIKIGNQIDLKLDSLNEIGESTFIKLKNKDTWYFIGEEDELDAIKISKKSDKYSIFEGKKLADKIVFESDYSSETKEDSIEFIFPIEKYILWQVVQNFKRLEDGDLEGIIKIEVPQKVDSIDPKYLLKFMEDMRKRTEPFFEMYLKNNVPLAMLAVNEGGFVGAIGRIQNEQKGFINFSNGTIEEFEKQKEIARTIIKEKSPFYIDGTSALFLSEIGYLEKVFKHIPNLKVPQSVINLLGEINEKFTYTLGQTGHMGYTQGKINYSSIDREKRKSIKNNIIGSVELLESNLDNIEVISSANKADCFSEQGIPSELNDACILAQKNNVPVLTEDYLYLNLNELETNKKSPEYFSSLALLRVLYEDKKISVDDYLDYFGYLSTYRFRFLSISSDDLETAVFGSGDIKTIKPKNIHKLNISLTLSEEYGIPSGLAYTIVCAFLVRVLMDNSITADIAELIFIEILETFPTKKNKKDLGQMLLRMCLGAIEKSKSKFILLHSNQIIYEKFDKLLRTIEIYSSEVQVWTPEK